MNKQGWFKKRCTGYVQEERDNADQKYLGKGRMKERYEKCKDKNY